MRRGIIFLQIFIFMLFSSYVFSAADILIESAKGGKNYEWYKEISGFWSDSVAKSTNPDKTPGIGSRFASSSVTEEAEARFTPVITEDGNYEIFVLWPRQANVYCIIYKIQSADGIAEIKKAQNGWGIGGTSNANEWNNLGVYHLKADNSNYVSIYKPAGKILPPDSRNSARIYTEAVKFVKTNDTVKKAEDDKLAIQQNAGSVNADANSTTAAPPEPSPASSASAPTTASTSPAALSPAQPTPNPAADKNFSPFTETNKSPAFIEPAKTEESVKTETAATPANLTSEPVQWIADLDEARKIAKKKDKNIMLYFFSSKSAECQKYDNEVFNDADVVKILNSKYACVLIDFNKNYQFALNLKIFKAPSFIFYDSEEIPLTQISEYTNRDEFLKIISKY